MAGSLHQTYNFQENLGNVWFGFSIARVLFSSVKKFIRNFIHNSHLSQRLRLRKHCLSEKFGFAVRNKKKRWLMEVKEPLILISQVQRSGGTLLSQLFDGHPECFSHPAEITWGRPEKWHWPQIDITQDKLGSIFEQVHESWINAYGGAGFYRKKPGYATKYPFIFDLTLQRQIFFKVVAENNVTSQRDILNAYLTSFFNAWTDYQNLYGSDKKFVVGFIPRLIVETSVAEYFTDYPDGYIISLVRDPMNWFVSARKHKHFRYVTNANELLKFWTDSCLATLKAKKSFPDRVLVYKFDSLITDTSKVMKHICTRTGLAYSDLMLKPTFNSVSIRSNSSVKSVYGIDQQVLSRSEGEFGLSLKEKSTIDAASSHLLGEILKVCEDI